LAGNVSTCQYDVPNRANGVNADGVKFNELTPVGQPWERLGPLGECNYECQWERKWE